MKSLIRATSVVVLMVTVGFAQAQPFETFERGVRVRAEFNKTELAVGEPLVLTINVTNVSAPHPLGTMDYRGHFSEGNDINLQIQEPGELPYRYEADEDQILFGSTDLNLEIGMKAHQEYLILYDQKKDGNFRSTADGAFEYFERIGTTTLFVFGELIPSIPDARFRMQGVQRVCEAMRRALLTYRAYQQDIFRQRSEANIVLSRNLGHDLTNIIATSKLELLAVRQLLSGSQELNGQRAEVLRESVQGLLENTKFLQEIVNIYRSFSHVKRPQYERNDLNLLVEDFLKLFERSVSARLVMRRDLQPAMPNPIVEPRLVKLALFNVLTNAADAMKRVARTDGHAEIRIATSHDPQTGVYQVQIDDNGPGIRDAQGRLLDSGEIDAIFQYGYSTKPEGSEGLGLSWVRTIVEDFHAGSVTARNLPNGGARFTLSIRSMEVAEAKVQGS